jgi:hypothetical protein
MSEEIMAIQLAAFLLLSLAFAGIVRAGMRHYATRSYRDAMAAVG